MASFFIRMLRDHLPSGARIGESYEAEPIASPVGSARLLARVEPGRDRIAGSGAVIEAEYFEPRERCDRCLARTDALEFLHGWLVCPACLGKR